MKFPLFASPIREYVVITLVTFALILDFLLPGARAFLFVAALAGSLPTFWGSFTSIVKRKISIDTFNMFALLISFITEEIRSAGFIVLMLAFASLLDWYTESRTRDAVGELLKLKPLSAMRERDGVIEEVHVDELKKDDILVMQVGARVPTDGVVVYGKGFLNESSVTGESVPVEKLSGDTVLGGTLNEEGTFKFRVTRVGKDSTLERMAALIRSAAQHKSHSEKIADVFATIFLPIVLAVGALTYVFTRNISMTAALFLVACADDMAVAIPLAITASIGQAAKRGVIVKGGEWLDRLGKAKTLILDKTGTLTYGAFAFRGANITAAVKEDEFWRLVAIAEKFSEHPVGRAIFKEAASHVREVPDPEEVDTYKGSGISAMHKNAYVAIGDESIATDLDITIPSAAHAAFKAAQDAYHGTTVFVFINEKFAGLISVADVPRKEAGESIAAIKKLGVENIVMLTGDNEKAAAGVSASLGITKFRAQVTPEEKLKEIELWTRTAPPLIMVGDGVNDAPALARADIGIAMGGTGTAVAVEAADLVVLTDKLSRIPEMVALGRLTTSVIKADMIIWFVTNMFGFALVLSGFAGPAFAAFYNFATDFLPLINSARLFRRK